MPFSPTSVWKRLRSGRIRILWLVLGALLLVSALPIGLYHRQVLQLSQDKLVDTEDVYKRQRGQRVPVSLYKITANYSVKPLSLIHI